jgi:nucleotide-binding universal stress UspA family protein
MLKRVLLPLNLHESKERVDNVCEFLKTLGTEEIVMLHVGSSSGGAGRHNSKKLSSAAARVEKLGFRTETAVRPGSVQMEIVYAAAEFEADYIAFSFRRKNWLKRAILGSNIKDVIRQSDIPVFVYKEKSRRAVEDEPYRVLYATSLQWKEDIIVSYIRNKEFKPDEVDFLYVGKRAPDPVVEQQRRDRIAEQMEELRKQCGLSESEARHIEVLGSPRRQIVKVAKRLPADVILLGKADTISGIGPVLGSTAEEVSYNATCSVLIIPRDLSPATEAAS